MIANASLTLSERVEIDTSDASGPALAPIDAPRLSIWLAICVAERVFVPRVIRSAVIEARPTFLAGSSEPPAPTRRLALISGRPGLGAITTRSPLASVFSTAGGTFAATAVPASGGDRRVASDASVKTGISDVAILIADVTIVGASTKVASAAPFCVSSGRYLIVTDFVSCMIDFATR